ISSLLVGLPYVWLIISLRNSPDQLNLMGRVGSFGREFSMPLLSFALVFVVATCAIYWKVKPRPLTTAILFVLAGSALGLQFQLISGFDAQHGHFWNRALQPLSLMLLGVLILPKLERVPVSRMLATGFFIGLIALGFYRQTRVAN